MEKTTKAILGLLLACSFCIGIAAHANGAGKPEVKLEVQKVEAAAYEALALGKGGGARSGITETLRLQGKVFLSVSLFILPQWTDEINRVRISAKEIMLVNDKGEASPAIGSFWHGELRDASPSLYASRPYNWKKEAPPAVFNAIFAVPDKSKSFEMKMGDNLRGKVLMPKKVLPLPTPAKNAKFEVLGARLTKEIHSEYPNRAFKTRTTITNPAGHMLEVKVAVTPTKGSGGDPNIFYWSTSSFGVRYDKKHYAPTAGELFMRVRINDHVSHNTHRNADGKWPVAKMTLYFPVPADMKTFELMYLMTPVAKGKVVASAAGKR